MDPIYWSIILLSLGLAVILLELFVPSAGILGVLATVLIVSGIIVAFFNSVQAGVIVLTITSLSLPLLLVLLLKIWPSTPIGRKVLIGRVNAEDVLPIGSHYDELSSLDGRFGRAKTKMLPSGTVVINKKSYDAVSDGFAIDPGDHIQVIAIRMNKIIVRKVEPDETIAKNPNDRDHLLSRPIDELGIDPIDG